MDKLKILYLNKSGELITNIKAINLIYNFNDEIYNINNLNEDLNNKNINDENDFLECICYHLNLLHNYIYNPIIKSDNILHGILCDIQTISYKYNDHYCSIKKVYITDNLISYEIILNDIKTTIYLSETQLFNYDCYHQPIGDYMYELITNKKYYNENNNSNHLKYLVNNKLLDLDKQIKNLQTEYDKFKQIQELLNENK